ncbi:fungal-specific transcription factor domain-containing protein, partial [Exophiala viscosa]|uniref:fungal-specific transcription factor domain-containing protein n=1 Tax=Exophiala viscosa TaxID=2486360 RepID=UPI00219B31BD
SERVVKKRASQACHHCRSRKVKCDLVKSGIPCHNCETDGIECVVIESRRSRKFRLQKRQLSGVVSLPSLLQARSKSASEAPSTQSENDQESIQNAGDRQVKEDATDSPTINHLFGSSPSLHQVNSQNSLSRQIDPAGTASRSSIQRRLSVDLPPYIRPVRPTIRSDDIEFLSRRGALSLPDTELRNQLLRCFILYVYPYMPIVDLEDILGAIDGKEGAPKISLTLFQAIMFAGTAFVDLELLLKSGYSDRRSARGDYFQKVKLLYDFDWDADRIPLIQSLLLGNYWYVSENDQKDPWHWLGVCISLATSIGVNQVVTYSKKDSKTCRLWRRLWWTCVLRDRIISASMRRPMRLKDEEINLSPLTLYDFETQPITTDIPALRDCPFITDTAIRKNLAQICIANIGICLCIGRIMKSLYHLRVFGGSTAEATMLYKPRMSQIDHEQISILQDDLDHWCKDLPNSCLLLSTVSSNVHDKSTEDVLFLHKAFLRMTYLMAVETLNRPQVLLGTTSTVSASMANGAVEQIAETTQWLQERNLVKFLQPLAVSFMLFSLASFLVDIKTKGRDSRDFQSQQFHNCIRALWQLRETWPIADSASFLVGQMISKSQV